MKKAFFAAIAAAALLSACNKPGASNATLKTDADTLAYALGVANSPSEEDIKMYLMQAGADSMYVEQFIKGMKDGIKAADSKKELAYQLGMQTGMQMKTRMFTSIENQVFAGDSTRHLSAKNFLIGQSDARKDKVVLTIDGEPATAQNVQPLLMDLMKRMQEKANEQVYGEKKAANEKFIQDVAKQDGVKALEGGVYYKVVKEGKGDTPAINSTVEVEYEGRLADGTVFDASRGETVKFACNQVIPGWSTALTHMPVGSEWEVYIPWNLAYGAQGSGPIPPYSALVFKIKLVSIVATPDAQ